MIVTVATLFMAGLSLITSVVGVMAVLFRRGQNDGRLTEILASLKAMAADHEMRIRSLERPQSRRLHT